MRRYTKLRYRIKVPVDEILVTSIVAHAPVGEQTQSKTTVLEACLESVSMPGDLTERLEPFLEGHRFPPRASSRRLPLFAGFGDQIADSPD